MERHPAVAAKVNGMVAAPARARQSFARAVALFEAEVGQARAQRADAQASVSTAARVLPDGAGDGADRATLAVNVAVHGTDLEAPTHVVDLRDELRICCRAARSSWSALGRRGGATGRPWRGCGSSTMPAGG